MRRELEEYSQVFVPPGGGDFAGAARVLKRRRREFLKRLERPVFVLGAMEEPGEELDWFFSSRCAVQSPEIVYLTGINQPEFLLFLDPTAEGNERETLFAPEFDAHHEFWNGLAFGLTPGRGGKFRPDPALRALTGISDQRPFSELPAFLKALKKRLRDRTVGIEGEVCDPFFAEDLGKQGFRTVSVSCAAAAQRVVLDAEQLSAMRRAQALTRDAFLAWAPKLPAFPDENVACRALEFELLSRTPWGLGFPTIAASGGNARTLHYVRNDSPLRKGSLLLADFGAKWGSISSDITRTLPVSGGFSPLQKLLYGIVLDVQKFHRAQVAPGKTIEKLDRRAWEYMEFLLQERFFARGGRAERPYEKSSAKKGPARPHGISHLIGEMVHEGDAKREYAKSPLLPGMVLSNEPGLYGVFEMEIGGKRVREEIGIRIENDLLVTEEGCEDLSRGIPAEPDEIEALVRGVFDRKGEPC